MRTALNQNIDAGILAEKTEKAVSGIPAKNAGEWIPIKINEAEALAAAGPAEEEIHQAITYERK